MAHFISIWNTNTPTCQGAIVRNGLETGSDEQVSSSSWEQTHENNHEERPDLKSKSTAWVISQLRWRILTFSCVFVIQVSF